MSNSSTVPIWHAPMPGDILLLVGPLLAGSLISFMLLGISIVQLYLYNVKFSHDRFLVQFSVSAIFILDLFQSVVVWALAWHSLGSGWNRYSALIFPGWTSSAIPAVTGIIAAWVQIFYAWRIYMMVDWKIIPIVIVLIALMQAGAALSIAISFIPIKSIFLLHITDMFPRTIIWLGGAALADVIISVSMVYVLYSAKKRVLKRTEKVLNRLICSTVETGIITTLCATLELGFFLGMPTNNLHAAFGLILSKLYSNAFMTSLNSRRKRPPEDSNAPGTWNSFDTTASYDFAHGIDTSTGVPTHTSTDIEAAVTTDQQSQPKIPVE